MEQQKNIIKSVGILAGATSLSLLFHKLGFTESNIIMVYILGVLLTSIATSHQLYSLVSSIASVFIYNYLFTLPRFSLAAYETGYPVTFVVMFLTAYITGTFAIRYKEQAGQSEKNARRTAILLETDQLLSRAGDKDEILNAAARQIRKLLNRNIVVYEVSDRQLSAPRLFWTETSESTKYNIEKESKIAQSVVCQHSDGRTTEMRSDSQTQIPDSKYHYFAMKIHDRVYGVVGIEVENDSLDASEQSILLSILGECALALENEQNAREKEAAAILAESEQLRANLLRAISHDLRTPLTSISGHASNLLYNGDTFDEETKQQIYSDIYEDSMWLIHLVENLLYSTRIEEGRMSLHTSTELLSEIVEESMRYINREAHSHQIVARGMDEILLVKADGKLIMQVIINIVDNAIKYTPPDSVISITLQKSDNMAEIQIADTGNGILEEEKQKIFDKFYCGANKIADNRRSLGLGLYLCKAIVEAHGGTICVADNQPRGTVFCFNLPLEEIALYE